MIREERIEADNRTTEPTVQPSALADDVAAFLALLGRLWRARFVVFAAILIALAMAIGLAQIMDKKYTVTTKLIPSRTSDVVLGPQANAASLGGILSFSGKGQDLRPSPFMRFSEMLFSQAVAELMIERDPSIMQVVFEHEWDPEAGAWKQPDGPTSGIGRTIRSALGKGEWIAPNASRLKDFMQEEITFVAAGNVGVFELSMEHKDPVFAQHFLALLRNSTDQLVRQSDVSWTAAMEQFIADRLTEVTQIDQRAELLRLRAQNERTLILASVDESYSAVVFDGPIVSTYPTSPNVPKIFIVLAALLVFITIALALMRKPRTGKPGKRRR